MSDIHDLLSPGVAAHLVAFDLDGTLRHHRNHPMEVFLNGLGQQEIFPGAKARLHALWKAGHYLAFITNQGGVARGYMTAEECDDIIAETFDLLDVTFVPLGTKLLHNGPPPKATLHSCYHATDAGCACRKPKPTMLLAAMQRIVMPPSRTWFVGDFESDRQCAKNAGVNFAWAWDWNPAMSVHRTPF